MKKKVKCSNVFYFISWNIFRSLSFALSSLLQLLNVTHCKFNFTLILEFLQLYFMYFFTLKILKLILENSGLKLEYLQQSISVVIVAFLLVRAGPKYQFRKTIHLTTAFCSLIWNLITSVNLSKLFWSPLLKKKKSRCYIQTKLFLDKLRRQLPTYSREKCLLSLDAPRVIKVLPADNQDFQK